ncbi:MAG: DUF5777 family beta-barrel protein [Thermoanaerobaculia bacterium]
MTKRRALLLALALAVPPPLAAQEAETWDPGYGDRFLQAPSPLVNDEGLFQVLFTHRFNQPVNEAGGNNLFGLDSGANIGIGLGYVPVDRLSVEVYRASSGGDYEFSAKYTLVPPTHERPLAVGVRAGMDWLTKYEVDKKTGFFGQALVAWTFGERVTISAAPTYVSNTPLFTDVFNVPVMLQVKLARGLYATGEYVFRNKDLDGSVGQWSFALEKSLFHHRFGVWIGNSAATTVDQIMAGDYAGGVVESNIRLGFNIVRQFEIGKKP